MAFVDGVGAAKFEGGRSWRKKEGEVSAGITEILAALGVGKVPVSAKGGGLKVLGSGRCGLGVRWGEGGYGGEQD